MSNVPYIDYKKLKEFYTIQELCELFAMPKGELKEKCRQYEVEPRRNEIGDYGFVKYDVRKLHNTLYHEEHDNRKRSQKEDDPWA